METEIKQIKNFWVYGNKYAILDSSNTIHAIGSLKDMKIYYNKLTNNKYYMENYGPFEIVKLTGDSSELFYKY